MDHSEPVCGLDVALAVMGGKWKPLILYHLQGGPTRFGELKRLVAGVSEKVLIQQLRELVAAGVLTRRDHQRVPPLCVWGTKHRAEVERAVGSPPSARDQAAAAPAELVLP